MSISFLNGFVFIKYLKNLLKNSEIQSMNQKVAFLSWEKRFQIPEEEKKKWKEAKTPESLLSYGLHHKIIPREEYFDWAVENYQTPFLKTDFFQNHTILSQNKWKRIKDLEKWSSQMVPLWFWENIVYVGCIEPHEKSFPFPHRFLLATDLCLKVVWNSLQERNEITQSFSLTREKNPPVREPFSTETMVLKHKAVSENNPPFAQSHSKVKEEKQSHSKIIDMKDYKKTEKTGSLKTDTNTTIITDNNTPYAKLCEKMKPWFVGTVIFKKEQTKLIPIEYAGRILLKDKNFTVNLTDHSFFSIINKDFPYHGPVIDTKINKEIFKNMKWEDTLPKHVSAIPLTTKEGESLVFFGVGKRKINMSEIESITEHVESFFQEEMEAIPLKKKRLIHKNH